MGKMQVLKKYFFFSFFLFAVTLVAFCAYVYFLILPSLPSIHKIAEYKPVTQTKFFDRNGKLLYEIGGERRIYVEIHKIPKNVINAFIAAEDRTFYTNSGVDFFGLARISILAIPNAMSGKRIGGASTISQQLIKNLLLSNERTVTRKLKEFILSYRLNKAFSKEKILEIYLNHIYLGSGAYGVAAASEVYFGKELKSLSVNEAALLATLPKAPSYINPFKNLQRSTERRNWVLLRMLEDKFISQEVYDEAIKTAIVLNKVQKNFYVGQIASWFAKDNIEKAFAVNDVINGGYNVHTTLDYDLQDAVQKILDNHILKINRSLGYTGAIGAMQNLDHWSVELSRFQSDRDIGELELGVILDVMEDYIKIGLKKDSIGIIKYSNLGWILNSGEKKTNKTIKDFFKKGDIITVKKIDQVNEYSLEEPMKINGAVVAIDPERGEILAMSGGAFDVPGNLNRATDAKRQIGSTIKPFVYAAAFDNKIKPNDIFMDSYISYNLEDGVTWVPKNVTNSFSGPMTARNALLQSVNTVTIRILEKIGVGKFARLIKDLQLNDPQDVNLSMALGSVDSSPLNLARAYSIFLNRGILKPIAIIRKFDSESLSSDVKIELDGINLTPIKKNQDNEGQEGSIDRQLISEESLYQTIYILQNHISARKFPTLKLFGKTGTSNNGVDLWFVGGSKSLMIVVYVGYDIPTHTSYTGQMVAMPIYLEIINEIKNSLKNDYFPAPRGIKYVRVNSKNGKITPNGDVYEAFHHDDKVESIEEVDDEGGQEESEF